MISSKGKRKVIYDGIQYYWYIKYPLIYIISEDKKLHLQYGFDKDIPIDTQYIKNLLSHYYERTDVDMKNENARASRHFTEKPAVHGAFRL